MSDIELVIKIPKRVYNYIRKYEHIANSDVLDIKDAIINSTPLPKGHGRIVDESKISKGTWNGKYLECNAPTIIPADKESD